MKKMTLSCYHKEEGKNMNRRKLILGGLLVIMLGCGQTLASTSPKNESENKTETKAESKVDTSAAPPPKTYTEEQFKQALKEEMSKQMRRMGNEGLIEFSQELLKKEEQLRIKEVEISKREEQLNINTKEFEKKINEFQEKQNKIIGCLEDQDKNKNKRIEHMVNTISGMKPVTAAEILSVQDPEIAVKILAQLDADKVAKIFNLMNKEISARLQKQYMDMKK
jgi:flagellar motility protein MotE (MotC chaperone)